jgi:dipeptidyl aminopeptidase/acylaminoacyl peptidase
LPAASGKDLPLVVLPHSGPASADTLDFDWWSQALAAQGYAVLQPNFRGSILDSKFLIFSRRTTPRTKLEPPALLPD